MTCGWRKELGGLRTGQAQRQTALEQGNSRLRRLVAELSPDNAMLRGLPQPMKWGLLPPMVTRKTTASGGAPAAALCRFGTTRLPSARSAPLPWPAARAGSQRYSPQPSEAEQRLTESIVRLATKHGRYGYRRMRAMLRGKVGE